MFYPDKINDQKVKKFFKEKKLEKLIKFNSQKELKVNELISKNPYKPNLKDLYSLYNLVLKNKRTTILEFGSGWSTLIFCLALSELKKKYGKKVKHLRRNNPFELFVIDNEKKFLKITKDRINKYFSFKLPIKINYMYSTVKMTKFNDKICTEYNNLPLCNPDFIYLDAPDQFMVSGNINGISTRHKDMVPMSSDLLKIEHFFNPGTIIAVDGRRSNSYFLKCNFQKRWLYKYSNFYDQHVFYLNEKPLGELSKKLINFYKRK
jgi:hypothetical protein